MGITEVVVHGSVIVNGKPFDGSEAEAFCREQ